MDKKVERLKALIKGNVKDRPTFGTDPRDPWSVKSNINEGGQLDKYLMSRGINPKTLSLQTKISHSKSNEFANWKSHQVREDLDQVDEKIKVKVSTDKPIGFKVADIGSGKKEYNVKTDKVWDDEQKKKTQKEEVEQIDEDDLLNQYLKTKGLNPKTASKISKIAASKTGDFDQWKRNRIRGGRLPVAPHVEQVTYLNSPTLKRQKTLDRAFQKSKPIRIAGPDMHRNVHKGQQNEEVDKKDTVTMDIPLLIRVLELAREDVKSDAELHRVVEKLIDIRNKGTLTMDDYDFVAKLKESIQLEDTYQDSYAATQTVGPENYSQSTDDTSTRKEPSNRVKMIKKIYKESRVFREDMYDREKEDKPVTTPRRKDAKVEQLPNASMVMTGGTTDTGKPRDNIEIDPLMKYRPGNTGFPPQTQKKNNNK
jgi:hypothetical protein